MGRTRAARLRAVVFGVRRDGTRVEFCTCEEKDCARASVCSCVSVFVIEKNGTSAGLKDSSMKSWSAGGEINGVEGAGGKGFSARLLRLGYESERGKCIAWRGRQQGTGTQGQDRHAPLQSDKGERGTYVLDVKPVPRVLVSQKSPTLEPEEFTVFGRKSPKNRILIRNDPKAVAAPRKAIRGLVPRKPWQPSPTN